MGSRRGVDLVHMGWTQRLRMLVKLIFSRQGFDSAAGGCPSPLIASRPLSLPIPTRMPTPTRYGDLANGIAQLVTDLTNGRITPEHSCQLDPDIDASALPRSHGWRARLVSWA